MIEETDRFTAVAPDGTKCTIVELTKMISHRAYSGTTTIPGPKEYKTSSGRDINPLAGGKFEDVLSGKIYVRNDD